jgi:hypothetical protein
MRSILIASLLAAAATLAPSSPDPTQPSPTPPLETYVSIVPTASLGYPLTWHNPPTFTCSAMVRRPPIPGRDVHGMSFGVDKLVVTPGHRETTSESVRGYDVQFTVKINSAADQADATVTILRGGTMVVKQNTTVALAGRARPVQ